MEAHFAISSQLYEVGFHIWGGGKKKRGSVGIMGLGMREKHPL
jgi:hypothetical protein